MADATAIGIGVLVAERWSSLNSGETIWALIAIPIWILVAKIDNLYDRDSRRIRHSKFQSVCAATASLKRRSTSERSSGRTCSRNNS